MVDLVDKYKDAAKTGRTLERPSLQKMLAEEPHNPIHLRGQMEG